MGIRFLNPREISWGHAPAAREEARLLHKIDFFIPTFTCLIFWLNYPSRTGFQFAFVSGMTKNLGYHGNQYSLVNILFTVGYIIATIPNILVLQVVPPHHCPPLTTALFAGLAMCLAAARAPTQVMSDRCLKGMAESSTFAGPHYILRSWYTETDISKHSGIFASSAQLGILYSRVIQDSIQTNLKGHRRLHAWQWQLFFHGFIGIPIALSGWIFSPDVSRGARKSLLPEPECRLAINRLPWRQQATIRIDRKLVKRVLGRWHWYAFSALFAWSSMLKSVNSNGLFQLWFAAEGYSVQDRDYWPLALQFVAIVATLVAAAVTDVLRIPRWTVNPIMAITLVFTSPVLFIWIVPFGLRFLAFSLAGMWYADQANNFEWANIVCAEDKQERIILLALMNLRSNVVQSGWSIFFCPATEAPTLWCGWIAMIFVAVVTVAISLAVRHLKLREQRQTSAVLRSFSNTLSAADHSSGDRPSHDDQLKKRAPRFASYRGRSGLANLGSPLLAFALAPVFCLLASSPASSATVHEWLNDEYHEDLHLRPLTTGRIQTAFTFTLRSPKTPYANSPGQGNNFHLLPSPLLSMLEDSGTRVKELTLSFNKGRWDYERWGMPYFTDPTGKEWGSAMVANGAETWARYESSVDQRARHGEPHPSDDQVEDFHSLLAALSGQFCSTLAATGSKETISAPSNMTRAFFGSTNSRACLTADHDVVLHLNLSPSPCTEVLHPFLALLPCKRAAGLASLLRSHAWLNTEWHGIELNVRRSRPHKQGWEVIVKVGSVWNGVLRNSKRDFSLSRIFGVSLTSACPLASTSRVTVLAPPQMVAGEDVGKNHFIAAPMPAGFELPHAVAADDDGSPRAVDVSGALSQRLRDKGQIIYDVAQSLAEFPNSGLDPGLTWPDEEHFNFTASADIPPSQTLHIKRSFFSTSQLEGRLLLTLNNNRMDRSRRVVYREVLPWFLSLDIHTASTRVSAFDLPDDSPFIRFKSDALQSPIRKLTYTEGVPRHRPEVLELELLVPSKARAEYSVRFEKHTIRYEEHPPDAHRGLDVGAATVWEIENYDDDVIARRASSKRSSAASNGSKEQKPSSLGLSANVKVLGMWKTEVALIELAVPDFSMPYNVIIFTSTILALFAGSAINLFTRRFVEVEVPFAAL